MWDNELREEMESNPEYKKAKKELALHFELADAILKARLKKGWSQEQLAEAIGSKQAIISRIETGLTNPTIAIIHKIFMHLGLEIKVIPSNLPSSFGQSFASSDIERP